MTTLPAFTRRATLALVLVAALASPALAGPPLVCFPFDIGTARSLPWAPDTGWKGLRDDYDLTKLTSDTTSLLSSSTPIVVRMETLRRAALYATRDEAVAKDLLDWTEPARPRGNRQWPPARSGSLRCRLSDRGVQTNHADLCQDRRTGGITRRVCHGAPEPGAVWERSRDRIRGRAHDERWQWRCRARRARASRTRRIFRATCCWPATSPRTSSAEVTTCKAACRIVTALPRSSSIPSTPPRSAFYCTASNSMSNTSVAFGGIDPLPDAPYASSGGMTSLRVPPTFIPGTP